MGGLPKGFWFEACYSCYVVRRSPSTVFWLKTLFEVWIGFSTDFDLRFSCPTCMHVIDGKLQMVKIHLFLGFEFRVNNYWLWFVTPSSPIC